METKKKETVQRIQAVPGKTSYPGVRKRNGGYEFTLELPRGKEAALVLYLKKNKKETEIMEIPFLEGSRRGNLVSLFVSGLPKGEICYNYRVDGNVIQDSYAKGLKNIPGFGERRDRSQICCVWKEEKFPWTDETFLAKPLEDSLYYKLQVRSFTMHKSSGVRKKGTFRGLEQKIPYLQELGVTGVLLMPAYEFYEIVENKKRPGNYPEPQGSVVGETVDLSKQEKIRLNCWGYTGDAFYFVPKTGFCATQDPEEEFSHMVNALHQAGLECLMELYFDDTMEPGMMLDIVRFWRIRYHVDGFRMIGNICQELFLKDPILADTKLFFSYIDGDRIYRGEEPEYKNAAEYNEGFFYCMRHMLKGDENTLKEFMFRNKRNPKQYGVINYIADQDGFSMMDMVSYEERHNEANEAENQDGTEYNCSWNCGAEGPSRKKEIRALRLQQLKNAFSMLLFAQGTPLIFQGDEWGHSQKGNNNAWCQDNELTWINWNQRKSRQELVDFVKEAIAFRKNQKILHLKQEPKGTDYKAFGYPDLSYHTSQAWYVSGEPGLRHLGMMYCKAYEEEEGEFVFFAWNFHWMPHDIALPGAPEDIIWKIAIRTDREKQEDLQEEVLITEKSIEVPPRTLIILTGKQDEKLWKSGSILRRSQSTSF